MDKRVVKVGQWEVGPQKPLLWILGPCVIESRDLVLSVADRILEISKKLNIQVVFKSSFDKANRSSGKTFRGPGIDEGLKIRIRHFRGIHPEAVKLDFMRRKLIRHRVDFSHRKLTGWNPDHAFEARILGDHRRLNLRQWIGRLSCCAFRVASL